MIAFIHNPVDKELWITYDAHNDSDYFMVIQIRHKELSLWANMGDKSYGYHFSGDVTIQAPEWDTVLRTCSAARSWK